MKFLLICCTQSITLEKSVFSVEKEDGFQEVSNEQFFYNLHIRFTHYNLSQICFSFEEHNFYVEKFHKFMNLNF